MTLTQEETERLRRAYRPATVGILFVGGVAAGRGDFLLLRQLEPGEIYLRSVRTSVRGAGDGQAVPSSISRSRLLPRRPVPDAYRRHEQTERRAARRAGVPPLADVLRQLQPDRIVVVMKAIEREVRQAVDKAGLAHIPLDVLPFPAMGHQRTYVEELVRLLVLIRE